MSADGSYSFVMAHHDSHPVLTAIYHTDIFEYKDRTEYLENVDIERFIPGDWEKAVEEMVSKIWRKFDQFDA